MYKNDNQVVWYVGSVAENCTADIHEAMYATCKFRRTTETISS